EGGVVEGPARRGGVPDQPGKLAPVRVVAGPAAFGGEVELVPPLELGAGRERQLAGGLAADQIAADRDQRLAALRPGRRKDVGRPRSPVETGDDGALDLERVHQRDRVEGEDGLLAVPRRLTRPKGGRAIAA